MRFGLSGGRLGAGVQYRISRRNRKISHVCMRSCPTNCRNQQNMTSNMRYPFCHLRTQTFMPVDPCTTVGDVNAFEVRFVIHFLAFHLHIFKTFKIIY